MKKFFIAFSAAMMTIATFTSCDPDEMRGMDLSGQWHGDFDMYYEIYCPYHHEYETYWADMTNIEFLPYRNTYTEGTGYQVDYYYDRNSPYDEVYHYFKWEIVNGKIYMYYRDEAEWDTVIRNYSLSNSYFSGYFDGTNNKFRLDKLADFHWHDAYHDDYYYHYRDDYYYDYMWPGKTRAGEETDSVTSELPRILHYGNWAAEGKHRE